MQLLDKETDGTKFRLIGIGVTDLSDDRPGRPARPRRCAAHARAAAEAAINALRDKFGQGDGRNRLHLRQGPAAEIRSAIRVLRTEQQSFLKSIRLGSSPVSCVRMCYACVLRIACRHRLLAPHCLAAVARGSRRSSNLKASSRCGWRRGCDRQRSCDGSRPATTADLNLFHPGNAFGIGFIRLLPWSACRRPASRHAASKLPAARHLGRSIAHDVGQFELTRTALTLISHRRAHFHQFTSAD